MAAQTSVDYLKVSDASPAIKWAALGLKDYVGNITQSVAHVFETYAFLDPPELRHRVDFADTYLASFEAKQAIAYIQQIDYKAFNYRLFNKLNTDMRNELFNTMRTSRFDNILTISTMYLETVRRLSEVLRKTDRVLEELNFRVANAKKTLNETMDTYFNVSKQWVDDAVETVENVGVWENDMFKKFRKTLRFREMPRNTAQYFTNVRKYVEIFMASVKNDLDLMVNYKHRELENFRIQMSLFDPIKQTTDVWIRISTDPDISSPCTENFMDKLLLYPNVSLKYFNKCLQKEIENENIASELLSDLVETHLQNIISAAYENYDICQQYSPKKLKFCLDTVSGQGVLSIWEVSLLPFFSQIGYEFSWTSKRMDDVRKEIQVLIENEVRTNFYNCIQQVKTFVRFHSVEEICLRDD
jgi:hypothetical protein